MKKPRTYGWMMDAAIACKTKEEAQVFIASEASYLLEVRPELVPEQARDIVAQNIGYATGYLNREEAARVLELFGVRHPIFGAIEDWPQTPEETIELGEKMGKQYLRKAS